MQPQDIVNKAINSVLTEWAVDFIDRRRADAKAKLQSSSGEGQQSFDHAIIRAEGSRLAEALFAFNGYLRTFDFKRLEWDRMPPVAEIEKFIKEKGAEKFVAKYKQNNPAKTFPVKTILINKIAWGIAISKQRKLKKRKRKRWYSKNYNKGIGGLYPQLLDALSKESLDQMKRELSQS